MPDLEYLVIGGGMAGVSAAYYLAQAGRVRVLEREPHLGYHSTGRSAALYQESYGNAVVRRLTRATGAFLRNPPRDFTEQALLRRRGTLLIARQEQLPSLRNTSVGLRASALDVMELDGNEAHALAPVLRPGYVHAALYDPTAEDIEVESLLRGYARGCKARGGEILQGVGIDAIERRGGQWCVSSDQGEHRAPVLVNATGAWADHTAALAGVAPLGLVPKRRTALIFPPDPHTNLRAMPSVIDVDETFYFKDEAGMIMASPADETESVPCDAMPDEWDVAVTVDRIQRATDFSIPRIIRQWAGLRTFAADRTPVVGYDALAPGFLWLAGQGGYGIQTSDALARAALSLAAGQPWPQDLADLDVTPEHLGPARLHLRA
jgi:D-arginine dehydrogenase